MFFAFIQHFACSEVNVSVVGYSCQQKWCNASKDLYGKSKGESSLGVHTARTVLYTGPTQKACAPKRKRGHTHTSLHRRSFRLVLTLP